MASCLHLQTYNSTSTFQTVDYSKFPSRNDIYEFCSPPSRFSRAESIDLPDQTNVELQHHHNTAMPSVTNTSPISPYRGGFLAKARYRRELAQLRASYTQRFPALPRKKPPTNLSQGGFPSTTQDSIDLPASTTPSPASPSVFVSPPVPSVPTSPLTFFSPPVPSPSSPSPIRLDAHPPHPFAVSHLSFSPNPLSVATHLQIESALSLSPEQPSALTALDDTEHHTAAHPTVQHATRPRRLRVRPPRRSTSQVPQANYTTRSGRVVRPPDRFMFGPTSTVVRAVYTTRSGRRVTPPSCFTFDSSGVPSY